MIQVLERFHRILLCFAGQPDRPRSLGELAERVGISSPACANIVRTMVELGYLRSLGKRRGYLPGPAAFFLFAANPYPFLVEVARPEMEALAAEKTSFVILVCEDGGFRRELFSISDTAIIQIQNRNPEALIMNLFRCSTGIMLLAQMEEPRVKRLWEIRGGENNFLAEPDFKRFCKRLQFFRKQGWGAFPNSEFRRVTCAAPIFQNGIVIAALGAIADLSLYTDPDLPAKNCVETAARISRLISREG